MDGALLARFSDLVEGIYAAALTPSFWPTALGGIARLHSCPAVHLLTPAIAPLMEGSATSTTWGLEDVERWTGPPPRAARSRDGQVFLDDEVLPGSELESTLFYLDYLRRVGVGGGGYCAGLVFDGSRPDLVATSCALFHGSDGRAFTRQDKEIHRLTVRHLSRALGTMYRLRDAQMKVAGSVAALDGIPTGVLLLGPRGNVLFANRSALATLAAQDGLRLVANGGPREELGWLKAADPAGQQHLEEGIREACMASVFPRTHFSSGIVLRRPRGQPVMLQLAALAPDNHFSIGQGSAVAVAFLSEPERVPRLDAAMLARAYGMTPAECLLAQHLAAGRGLPTAARELGVALNTVKTQLQSIFQKTGANRQSELSRVLLGAAGFANDAGFGRDGAGRAAVISALADDDDRRVAMKGANTAISMMVVLDVAKPSRPMRSRRAFPCAPTTITVGFAPGGATDIFARIVARKLADNIGLPVVVENRTGSSGSAGWRNLLAARPDGYTLHVAGVEGLAVSALTRTDLAYEPMRDFAPVAMGAISPILYVVRDGLPARTLREFLALARERPGELSYASPGPTTTNHLAGALLAACAGVSLLHVPYKGGGPAMVDLLDGRVAMYPAQIPTSKLHVEAGRLRALATAGAERPAGMPSIPTVAEHGYPGFDVKTSYAFFASRRVPGERLDYWNHEIARVLADPQVREQLARQGLQPAPGSRAALQENLSTAHERWGALIRGGKLRLD